MRQKIRSKSDLIIASILFTIFLVAAAVTGIYLYTIPFNSIGYMSYRLVFVKNPIHSLILLVSIFGVALVHLGVRNVKIYNDDSMYIGRYKFNDVYIYKSETNGCEVVNLSKEDIKKHKLGFHLKNKYLKFYQKYREPQYMYVGCYSNKQIRRIMEFFNP